MVVSNVPTYEIELAILFLCCLFTNTIPLGIGPPINLCPDIEILSTPSEKSNLGFGSAKGATHPKKAASQCM